MCATFPRVLPQNKIEPKGVDASKLTEPCSTHFFELINQRAGGNPLQCFGVKKRSGRESIRKHDIEMRLPGAVSNLLVKIGKIEHS